MSEGSRETHDAQNAPTLGPGRSVLSYGVEEPKRESSLATLALFASLLFFPLIALGIGGRIPPLTWVGLAMPVVAIVVAKNVLRRSTVRPSTRRQAHAAIWTAIVQLVLCAVAVCLLPGGSGGRAREPANRIKCASNLKQIAWALQLYANNNGGTYPPSFDELVLEGEVTPEVFLCPSSADERAYGPTTRAVLQDFHAPGHCSYVYTIPPGTAAAAITAKHILAYEPLVNHAGNGINVVYGD